MAKLDARTSRPSQRVPKQYVGSRKRFACRILPIYNSFRQYAGGNGEFSERRLQYRRNAFFFRQHNAMFRNRPKRLVQFTDDEAYPAIAFRTIS